MRILSIDPGNEKSAYVIMDENYYPIRFGLVDNTEMVTIMKMEEYNHLAIEMVASYGMAVGKTVFDTCVWIGRFIGIALDRNIEYTKVYRIEEKLAICHDSRAKDANIRQALIDRFGVVGTKKNPGWFYGFKKDIWAAYSVGVTFLDTHKENISSIV